MNQKGHGKFLGQQCHFIDENHEAKEVKSLAQGHMMTKSEILNFSAMVAHREGTTHGQTHTLSHCFLWPQRRGLLKCIKILVGGDLSSFKETLPSLPCF